MSAGGFVKAKYAASYDADSNIHPIRVQPETITCEINGVANDEPAGDITNPISALVSRGRRARGLIARTVTLVSAVTGQPTGYKAGGFTTIPCLTEAFYEQAALATNLTTVSYNGVSTYKVAYVTDERVK